MNAPPVPWLAAPFRPFYLLGAGYGVVLMALAALGFAGMTPGAFPMAWHGHEMVFGFAMAIIAGTLLTALPTWAGAAETRGARLAGLVALWLAGRVANMLAPGLPWLLPALGDAALPLAMVLILAPQLARLPHKRWLGSLVVLAAFAAANFAWHAAVARGDAIGATQALRAALWLLVVIFTLAGGLFTPVFTANVLEARGLPGPQPRRWAIEGAAVALTVGAAAADTMALRSGTAAPVAGALAFAAALAQAWRVARWRGWHAANEPLVAAMHIGFVWLVVALLLCACANFGWLGMQASWLHAFTAGALGSMMLGLMTRVALRHTGRELRAPRWLPEAIAAMGLATVLRLAAPWLGTAAWTGAALLWALALAAWWVQHAAVLVRASLPARTE